MRLEVEDSPDIRQAPAVDRLVVVADEEDPVRRGGEQQRKPKLRAVDVLDLVDQQLSAAPTPARQQGGVALEGRDRPKDQVVEIEAATRGHGLFVGHEGQRHRPGVRIGGDVRLGHAQLDLEPGDDRIEPEPLGLVGPRRHLGQDGRAVGQRFGGLAGIEQDLAAEGMERPDPDVTGRDPERRDRSVKALGHLRRGPLVEGDRPDGVGRRPGRDEPRGARHERRGLAAAGRGDAQRRSGRRGGRGPLVRRQASEAFRH